MSCEKYEIELLESFGMNALSTELQNHLAICASCKIVYENLLSTAIAIGSDEIFYEPKEIITQKVEAVNNKIDALELSNVVDVSNRWKSYVPLAAALLIIVAVGLMTTFLLQFDSTSQIANNNTNNNNIFVSLDDADTQSLSEIEFSEFVDSYTTEYGLETELNLLDDMSEEEYKYLEENLNIGEIL